MSNQNVMPPSVKSVSQLMNKQNAVPPSVNAKPSAVKSVSQLMDTLNVMPHFDINAIAAPTHGV